MVAGLWRTAPRFALILVLGAFTVGAQEPAHKALPDPPSPARTDGPPTSTAPSRAAILPIRPPASNGLSRRQKYALAYRRIVSPQMPLKAVFISGFELAAGTGPAFSTKGFSAFGDRVGYNALSISTTNFFDTAFVPSLVHQDPRYFPLGKGAIYVRVAWAIRSELVAFGDNGRTMPNYGNLAGLGLSAILANAYLPGPSRGVQNTFEAYGIKLCAGAGLNVAREFAAFDKLKTLARHSKVWRK